MTDPYDARADAAEQRDFYIGNVKQTRWKFYASETLVLVVSAAVTITGVLIPHDARGPASLGALVALLTGLRAVFHWRENWIRSATAAARITAEIRLYDAGVPPYDQTATKQAKLAETLSTIGSREVDDWSGLPGPSAPTTAKAG